MAKNRVHFVLQAKGGAPDDRYDALIRDAIAEAGGRHPPPLALVKAVVRQESGFRPTAVSRAGARGLMQVMPGTAKRIGVRPEDLFEPAQNIRAGVRLLSVLLDHYRGDIISTLVAYNARPRRLFAPIPRNGETPGYVWAVLAYYEWYSGHRRQRLGRAWRDCARRSACAIRPFVHAGSAGRLLMRSSEEAKRGTRWTPMV